MVGLISRRAYVSACFRCATPRGKRGTLSDALLRGAPLLQAEERLHKRRVDLGEMEINYIQTSLKLRDKEQARREKRRRNTIIALASGLMITIVLGLFAVGQWRRAENERDIAFSRELAAASNSNLNLDPELSILLALSAV